MTGTSRNASERSGDVLVCAQRPLAKSEVFALVERGCHWSAMSRLGIRGGLGLVEHVGGGCCSGDVGESCQLGAEEWGFAAAGDDHRSLVGHGRDDSMVGVCPEDPIGFEGYSVERVEGTESSQVVGVEVGCTRPVATPLYERRHP